jgi:hypothetical protein
MEELMSSRKVRVLGIALVAMSGAWMSAAQAGDQNQVVAQATPARAPVVIAQAGSTAAPFKSGPVQAQNVAPGIAGAGGATAAMGTLVAGTVAMVATGGSSSTVSH